MFSSRLVSSLAIAAVVAACAAQGAAENPVSRVATWFDYVGAGDVRASCGAGSPNHYRFVYNAIYSEQVRAYEVTQNPVLSGGTVDARAMPTLNLAQVNVASLDIFIHGAISRQQLSAAELEELDRALAADADAYAAPRDTYLRSDRFYWTVGACRSGRLYFAAFDDMHPGFEQLHFPALLFRHDTTEIKVNLPRRLYNDTWTMRDYQEHRLDDNRGAPKFLLQVGDNALKR